MSTIPPPPDSGVLVADNATSASEDSTMSGNSKAPAQRFEDVLRELTSAQTRVFIFEHLGTVALEVFYGTEVRGPTKLLVMPDGTKRAADLDDVLMVRAQLDSLAKNERARIEAIYAAAVSVDAAALERGVSTVNDRPHPGDAVAGVEVQPPLPGSPVEPIEPACAGGR